ncbi:hypothetical protein LWI29_019232 [Acer saccharum]|uniref:GOLD domain-containing protein n=1 Tax=Acer saccharum TaxID=4024 RepID=A0AA39S4F3_ACESA|nr:hypothetical protein LWI29_019232 [Acer saccharum]
MQVTSSQGDIVHYLKGASEDKFEFKAPYRGIYQFCFKNPSSTPEAVSFYIHVGHIPNEQDLAKDGQFQYYNSNQSLLFAQNQVVNCICAEHVNPVSVKIAELRQALASVTAEQRYLKARESQHRYSYTLLLS